MGTIRKIQQLGDGSNCRLRGFKDLRVVNVHNLDALPADVIEHGFQRIINLIIFYEMNAT